MRTVRPMSQPRPPHQVKRRWALRLRRIMRLCKPKGHVRKSLSYRLGLAASRSPIKRQSLLESVQMCARVTSGRVRRGTQQHRARRSSSKARRSRVVFSRRANSRPSLTP